MGVLPSGTVTLLFTDIEGSTRLVHELGDGYPAVLAEHHRVMRDAIAGHGGVELGTEGDAFFVAFESASGAVGAAAEAQRGLASGPVRVRMGLHTGQPLLTEDGYVGIDLHRAARIAAAGHGGQVLVSAATRSLLDDSLLFRDLGDHRLKDLAEPERLFQLGDGEFPPLKSLNNTNLPLPPSPLVGRRDEVDEVTGLLRRDDVRLVTLTGAGGTGKTRLALAVAGELIDEFPNGVFFVSLAAVAEPELVVVAVAQTLGVRETAGEPLAQTLAAFLEDKSLLLVLDNFEHVVGGAADLAEPLRRAPRLRLLATSREPLHLSGEHEFALPPLAADEAVALFVERARAIRSDFALNGNAPVAAAICDRLDRLPLAIELAAARVKALSLEAMLDRLGQRLSLAAGRGSDLPERQRTLRATIEWSHDLLDEAERGLYSRLSVFAGGWTLEAAEEASRADLDVLLSLVDKSLVRHGGDDRYSLLETIREHAAEQLAASGEEDGLRLAHAHYFLAFAEGAEKELRGPDQLSWFARLEAEHDNFRAALGWLLERDGERGLRLASALGRFWYVRAHAREGFRWLEHALAAAQGVEAAEKARGVYLLGVLADELGDLDRAAASFEHALAFRRESDDRRGAALALNSLGVVARNRGDRAAARGYYTEALAIKRELGDPAEISTTLCGMGLLAVDEGNLDEAVALLEESLELDRSVADVGGIASNLSNLAAVAIEQRDVVRARPLIDEAVRAFRELGDRDGIAESLEQVASIAAMSGRSERAARLGGAAAALREALGMPVALADLGRLEGHLQPARDALAPGEFERAFAEGRELDDEQAVAEALREVQGLP